jgi:hypothetical protein
LWLCVKRARVLPESSRWPDDILDNVTAKVRQAITFAKAAGEMQRDSEAREIWHGVYPKLSEGKLGLFGKVISRAEAQVLRLSCNYALLDSSPIVRAEHLLAALAFWDFCERSARYLFGDSLGDPIADQILRALKASQNGLLRSEIGDLFGRNKSSREIGQALGILAESGLASSRREESGGRPHDRWFALVAGTN